MPVAGAGTVRFLSTSGVRCDAYRQTPIVSGKWANGAEPAQEKPSQTALNAIGQREAKTGNARKEMARWMGLAADWLRPIYEKIRTGVMAGGYLQIDETPIRYLSPGHGQTKLGYFWIALSPGGDVVYHWESSSRLPQERDRGELPRHP